ncbi:MAG: outer membrane lipoprotein-sorting protein, partial [Bacteroidota bacterium]
FAKPGLRRPVAISSRQRLSGSAANADVASANYFNEYDIESSEEETFEGTACWVLELKAKNNLVSYPRIKYWISKDQQFGLQAAFYGKSKKLIKVAQFKYDNTFTYEGKDHGFVSEVIIFDKINEADKTTLVLDNIRLKKYNNSKFQKGRMLDE